MDMDINDLLKKLEVSWQKFAKLMLNRKNVAVTVEYAGEYFGEIELGRRTKINLKVPDFFDIDVIRGIFIHELAHALYSTVSSARGLLEDVYVEYRCNFLRLFLLKARFHFLRTHLLKGNINSAFGHYLCLFLRLHEIEGGKELRELLRKFFILKLRKEEVEKWERRVIEYIESRLQQKPFEQVDDLQLNEWGEWGESIKTERVDEKITKHDLKEWEDVKKEIMLVDKKDKEVERHDKLEDIDIESIDKDKEVDEEENEEEGEVIGEAVLKTEEGGMGAGEMEKTEEEAKLKEMIIEKIDDFEQFNIKFERRINKFDIWSVDGWWSSETPPFNLAYPKFKVGVFRTTEYNLWGQRVAPQRLIRTDGKIFIRKKLKRGRPSVLLIVDNSPSMVKYLFTVSKFVHLVTRLAYKLKEIYLRIIVFNEKATELLPEQIMMNDKVFVFKHHGYTTLVASAFQLASMMPPPDFIMMVTDCEWFDMRETLNKFLRKFERKPIWIGVPETAVESENENNLLPAIRQFGNIRIAAVSFRDWKGLWEAFCHYARTLSVQ